MAFAVRSTQLAGFVVGLAGGGATVVVWVALPDTLGELLPEAVVLPVAEEVPDAPGEEVAGEPSPPLPQADTVISRPRPRPAAMAWPRRVRAERDRGAAGAVGWGRTVEPHTSSSAGEAGTGVAFPTRLAP
jgi:hypothetical protein